MFKVVSSFVSQIPEIPRTDHPILGAFSRILRYFTLGLLGFELSLLIKKSLFWLEKLKVKER